MKKFTCCLMLFKFLVFSSGISWAQKGPEINHVAISVKELNRSIRFYTEVIGLNTIPEPFNDGRHAWFSIGENISLHIIQDAHETKTYYKNSHLCLSTLNLAAFIMRLKKEGIEFENVKGVKGEVTVRVDGVQQVYFKDPDGYWIEINDSKNQ